MARPLNQAQTSGKLRKYRWGDGHGAVHSRPKKNRGHGSAGGGNGGGQGTGGGHPAPVDYTQPLPYSQIVKNAGTAANLQYGAVQAQQAQQGQQIPAWFQQYRDSLQGAQTQAQQSYQPAIAQQNQLAQDTGQNLGLQGQAGQTDQLAAAGREALAHLGLAQLQNALSQTTNYYAGRKGVADAAQIGANTQLSNAKAQTAKDKGAYKQSQIDQGVQTERNYGISVQHQNAENAAFGVKVAAAADKANTPNKYGVPPKQWASWSTAHRDRFIAAFNKTTARPGKPARPGDPKYGVDAATWAKMTTAQRMAAKKAWDSGTKVPGAGGGKDRFGNTPRQQQVANSSWKKIKLNAKTLYKPGESPAELYKILVFQYPTLDSDMLEAAATHATGGKLTAKQRKALARQGVHLGKPGKGGTTVTRPPNAPGANGQSRPT